MGGGSIVRHDCGRLVIYGQHCVCVAKEAMECGCWTDARGNWCLSPECRQAEKDSWAAAMRRGRSLVRVLRAQPTTDTDHGGGSADESEA